MSVRTRYLLALILVIAVGLLSRLYPIGNILWDKYLGDALYATMLYVGLGFLWPSQPISSRTTMALLAVAAIEVFQLTGIPANLAQHPNSLSQLVSRALGTHFGWLDMLAYLFGVIPAALWQYRHKTNNQEQPEVCM